MRYTECMPTRKLNLKPFPRSPLRERVYEMLQEAIVAGELPPGTRLRDQEIADQVGVSRTPVREALQMLEVLGLVETRPGASTTVTAVDVGMALDVFPVAATLHGLAARLGMENLTDRHMRDMVRYNERVEVASQRGDRQAMMEADSAFHGVLVEASGNKVISDLLQRLTVTVRRFEYDLFDSDTGHASAHDHDDIINACRDRNAQLVESLVHQNWLTLGHRIIGSVSRGRGDRSNQEGEDDASRWKDLGEPVDSETANKSRHVDD